MSRLGAIVSCLVAIAVVSPIGQDAEPHVPECQNRRELHVQLLLRACAELHSVGAIMVT